MAVDMPLDFFDDLFGEHQTEYSPGSNGGSVDSSSDSGHGSPVSFVTSSTNSPVSMTV